MTTTSTNRTPAEQISPEEWQWVHSLIQDVVHDGVTDEECKKIIGSAYQWDLAVKQFRKVEMKRLILGEPDALDFEYHALCLHALLTMGRALKIQLSNIAPAESAKLNLESDLTCYIEELEQSLREWHSGFTLEEIEAAQKKIFGAAA